MSKKDFFSIVIKLFGLYYLINTVLPTIPLLLFNLVNTFNFPYTIFVTVYFAFNIFVVVYLLFHSDKIISFLKLDSGFEVDKIEFSNFSSLNLLRLALIIIGSLLIVNNISQFISQAYYFVQLHMSMGNSDTVSYTSQDNYKWAISAVNLIIGYVLITNYPGLSNYLLKITQKKE